MRAMFNTVAPRHDFITRAFSYGMDRRWKRLGFELAPLPKRPVVLDLASGTGDFSLLVTQQYPGPARLRWITGRCFSLPGRGVDRRYGDAACFPSRPTFDCVFVGYGLRNFPT